MRGKRGNGGPGWLTLGDLHLASRVAILHHNNMVGLEEGAPAGGREKGSGQAQEFEGSEGLGASGNRRNPRERSVRLSKQKGAEKERRVEGQRKKADAGRGREGPSNSKQREQQQ